VDPEIEQEISEAVTEVDGDQFLGLSGERVGVITKIIGDFYERHGMSQGDAVILTVTEVRRYLKKMIKGDLPDVGVSRAPRMCIKVDLPEPDGPMMATNSPFSILKLTPARA